MTKIDVKIRSEHLERRAVVYIQQALPRMLPLKVGINAPGSRVSFAQGD
jgi:hypothetical protein